MLNDTRFEKTIRVSYELRNRLRLPWSLCSLVVEHRSVESEGLRFNSSWGLRIFFFVPYLSKKKIFLSNEHVALPGDEIRFAVDNTSFPKAIQIMVVNNTEISDFN